MDEFHVESRLLNSTWSIDVEQEFGRETVCIWKKPEKERFHAEKGGPKIVAPLFPKKHVLVPS